MYKIFFMEAWLLYALFSVFFGGIHAFMLKIAAVRHYNISLLSIYSYASGSLWALVYIAYAGLNLSNFIMLVVLSAINVIFYFWSIITRVESMRNIDSVLFFPIFKTIWPIMITALSVIYFWESLSLKEIIGIIIGITVPLWLISAHENKRQVNLKRGIIFLVFTVLLTLVSTTILKEIQVKDFNIPMFVFLTSFIGIAISYIKYRYSKGRETMENYETKWLIYFSVLLGIMHFLAFVTFILALSGNLAVVFTINSFGILIPIVLSIIFYKDHFNMNKGFVIALSIVSIILFL